MTDWTSRSAGAIAAAVKAGEITARSVVEAHLAAVAARNGTLNAFTDILAERALARADAIDRMRAGGAPLPPLAGVPFAAKNLYDIAGLATHAGSRINRDLPPAEADSPLIQRLEAAGAILIGATNMTEYAYGFTSDNAHDGPARNPHDTARTTGGSSSGTAAAVAGGLATFGLGSDTNGSIRVPAAFCGLFGLKPTYGALSRAGSFPFVSSLDHLGPLARTAADCALAFDAMAGPDTADPMCARSKPAPVVPELAKGLAGIRIARAAGHYAQNGMPDVLAAVSVAADRLGATDEVVFPEAHRARAAAFVITMVEGAALHRGRLKARAADFDPEVRDRLIAGAILPGAWVMQAQRFRRWFLDQALGLFATHDVILAPAVPCVAPKIGERTFVLDGVELPVRAHLGVYTQPISFIGLPVMTVPLATAGLPIGVQLIAAPGREDLALRVAAAMESEGIARSGTAWIKPASDGIVKTRKN
jgi:1-carboxybiuret hydrolase